MDCLFMDSLIPDLIRRQIHRALSETRTFPFRDRHVHTVLYDLFAPPYSPRRMRVGPYSDGCAQSCSPPSCSCEWSSCSCVILAPNSLLNSCSSLQCLPFSNPIVL